MAGRGGGRQKAGQAQRQEARQVGDCGAALTPRCSQPLVVVNGKPGVIRRILNPEEVVECVRQQLPDAGRAPAGRPTDETLVTHDGGSSAPAFRVASVDFLKMSAHAQLRLLSCTALFITTQVGVVTCSQEWRRKCWKPGGHSQVLSNES